MAAGGRIKLRFRAGAADDGELCVLVWPHRVPFTVETNLPGVLPPRMEVRDRDLDGFASALMLWLKDADWWSAGRKGTKQLRIDFEAEGGAIVGHLYWPQSGDRLKARDEREGGFERDAPTLTDLAEEFAEGGRDG